MFGVGVFGSRLFGGATENASLNLGIASAAHAQNANSLNLDNSFPAGWTHRQKFTVNNGLIETSESIDGYVARFTHDVIHPSVYGIAKSDGGDVWFSSDPQGLHRLPVDISSFTSTNTEIDVRIFSLTKYGDNEFYLWAGKASATQPAANEPFGYDEVWAGYETPTGNLLNTYNNNRNTPSLFFTTTPSEVLNGPTVLTIGNRKHNFGSTNIDFGGVIEFVVQDGVHSHLADSTSFTQVNELLISPTIHDLLSDNIVITELATPVLGLLTATHSHIADVITHSQINTLDIDNSLNTQGLDKVYLRPTVGIWQIQGEKTSNWITQ